jgi:DNA-binding NtrC family response regulator
VHNLVINADQAMPNGGTVLIQGTNVTLPPDNPYALTPGDHLLVSIQDEGIISGSARTLVMDDEDFIRELVSAMRPKMGHDVALAQDGQAAANMYKDALETGAPFDAVILDLTIPGGMGGKETLNQPSALDPSVRAIVSGGYSNDPVMANHDSYGFCGAVEKPYLVQETSQVLNAVITGNPKGSISRRMD